LRVAVTGGSGVVGTAVVRHLVASGDEVWALARSPQSSSKLAHLGASVVHGDVLDANAVDRLVKASERVFHIAGVNELCSRDPSRMWRVNVDATLSVLEASARAGVSRFVHTSSAVTVGEDKGTVGTEESKHRGHFLSEYERSKTVAERLVFDSARDIEVVSVNPSSVQGPGRATGTGALLLAAARGSLPALVDTTVSLVDIDDCARGHLLAAEQGRPGERYILSGAVTSIREAVTELNRQLGRPRRTWFIKASALTAIAPLIDASFRVVGKASPLCSESVRVLLNGHEYDGSKATRALGLDYTPLPQTLSRAIDWFRAEGLVA
jgi:dihydroflavonol-4-reductase